MDNYCVNGSIVPPVRYFLFEGSDGDDTEVFAHDRNDALLIYYAYHHSAFGRFPEQCNFKEASRLTLADRKSGLLDDMEAGLVGIAGWTLVDGWRIYPPEHEIAGE